MKKLLPLLLILALLSCKDQTKKEKFLEEKKITVITVNYPLYYFAKRIGATHIDLEYIIPPDVDPAQWKPDEQELETYQSADIILANGAGYAGWMEKVSLASSRIINTSSNYSKDFIPLEKVASHSHGPEGEHEHTGHAFTTWLDFKLALKQAASIRDVLIRKIPHKKAEFDANFAKLEKDLEQLDQKMIQIASKLKQAILLGSHPVYQYLSRAYDLDIQSVHFEPHEFPSEKQWDELDQFLSKSTPNIMLWEGDPMLEIGNKLKSMGIIPTTFDPCPNKPDKGDFLSVMNRNMNLLTAIHQEAIK